MIATASRTAHIRATAAQDPKAAEGLLSAFLAETFGLAVTNVAINFDQYSLNSLNGFFDCEKGPCFFKFHQEEGEEAMRGEYYRADILARAGLPVDQPILSSTQAGEQILIYRRRTDPRFADVLLALDHQPNPAAATRALAAEADLNAHLLAVAKSSLHPITAAQSGSEPIHRLFHERLVDAEHKTWPGGRFAAFYLDQDFDLGGLQTSWAEIKDARPRINGVAYQDSLGELFARAYQRLTPDALADAGGIVAHGDAHNANVWYERTTDPSQNDRLAFFDPAFAGSDVPSLLAEVKSTFHNTLAHPLWLYNSAEAAQTYQATARLRDGELHIDTNWSPNALRRDLLDVKAHSFWRPWLAHLKSHAMLPDDWENVIRLGLFLCPTLVMNLRAHADRHNPVSSAIGLGVAISLGSRPIGLDQDLMVEFINKIRPD